MIKGAIFDLDGTLLDSMYIWENAGALYLRSLGIEPTTELVSQFKNASLYQAACMMKKDCRIPLSTEEIMQGINKAVEGFYINDVQLKPGVVQLLDRLKSKNVKMCIATATDRYQVEAALKRCKVYEYFSEIFTCTEIGHGKDEPMIFRAALSHLNTEKENTLIFEDALYAIKTAKEDGFNVVAVYDRYETDPEAVKSLSDFYIYDYRSIEL